MREQGKRLISRGRLQLRASKREKEFGRLETAYLKGACVFINANERFAVNTEEVEEERLTVNLVITDLG